MFHPRRHTADNSLPVVTFFFISCLFVCCFFSLLHNSLKKESGCRDVSVRLSHQGGGGGGGGWGWQWRWRWMAVDGGGWGPVTVTCNTALIGVTSPAEGGVVLH